MLTIMAGPDLHLDAGATADLPDAEARALIDGGYAVAVGDPPAEEPESGADAEPEPNSKTKKTKGK